MLTSLKIKNFIIIESTEISLGSGLTVLTGETGAGKSILINALKLVLGGRASVDVIRKGSQEAEIQASFDVSGNKKAKELLIEFGIELDDNELLVRRSINIKGHSKIYINDVSVTLATLSRLTPVIIDICSQFENQSLFSSEYQLSLVDKYAQNSEKLSSFGSFYREIVRIKKEIKELEGLDSEREKKLDYYKYQFEEIDSVDPKENEDEDLENEVETLSKSKELFGVIKQIENAFYHDDSSIISQLESIKSKFNRINLPFTRPYEEKINKIITLAEEVGNGLISQKKQVKFDPAKINDITNRLELLRKLKRKYGGSISSVILKREELRKEINKMLNAESSKKELKKQLEKVLEEAKKIGSELNKSRMEAAKEISNKVTEELQELNMKGSALNVELTYDISNIGPHGFDEINIHFAPNKGEPFGLLERIASGGELSRVTLAIHKVLRKSQENKVYIFDEVDSGIGGDTGRVVGKKLKEISKSNQVICITHLAQVAAFGDNQHVLKKEDKQDRVISSISGLLSFDDRVKEIARMLSGRKDEKEALDHALKLLQDSLK